MLWLFDEWINITGRLDWSGYMTTATADRYHFELSTTEILPFIHMDPGNMDTICSAIVFASNEIKKRGKHTCMVTFDQPLFTKVTHIVGASNECPAGISSSSLSA